MVDLLSFEENFLFSFQVFNMNTEEALVFSNHESSFYYLLSDGYNMSKLLIKLASRDIIKLEMFSNRGKGDMVKIFDY